ncbi:hypothetical protein HRD50_41535, partial [Corallococcus exiguus]|nr:hypothetical protein [Corallococcus exiguus]
MKPLPRSLPSRRLDTASVPSWLRPRLEALFGAVELLSPTCFRFAGGPPVDVG